MGRGSGQTVSATAVLRAPVGGEPDVSLSMADTDPDRASERYERFCAQHLHIVQVTDPDGVAAMMSELRDRRARRLELDFETGALSPTDGSLRLIQIGYEDPGTGLRRQWLVDLFATDPGEIPKIIESRKCEKIVQMSGFEAVWAKVQLGANLHACFDTWAAWCVIQKKLERMPRSDAQAILPGWDGKFKNSLSDIALHRLGVLVPKSERVSDWTTPELSAEQIRYAALDVAILPDIARDARRVMARMGISEREVNGLRNWKVGKDWEEKELHAAQDRDQHDGVARMLRSARGIGELDHTWERSRRATLTHENRARLRELYHSLRASA